MGIIFTWDCGNVNSPPTGLTKVGLPTNPASPYDTYTIFNTNTEAMALSSAGNFDIRQGAIKINYASLTAASNTTDRGLFGTSLGGGIETEGHAYVLKSTFGIGPALWFQIDDGATPSLEHRLVVLLSDLYAVAEWQNEHEYIFYWDEAAPVIGTGATERYMGIKVDGVAVPVADYATFTTNISAPWDTDSPTAVSSYWLGNRQLNAITANGNVYDFAIADDPTETFVTNSNLPTAYFNALNLWPMKPNAVYQDGKTYRGFGVDESNPDDTISIAEYDHTTGFWTKYDSGSTMQTASPDAHGSPTLNVDSAGYLYLTFGSYTGATDAIYVKKSTNINDASAWDSALIPKDLTGGHEFTYPILEFSTSDDLILFYRQDTSANLSQFKRIILDDGDTVWRDDLAVLSGLTAVANERPYANACMYNDRLYIIWHQQNKTTGHFENLYLIYTDNPTAASPTWYAMDGTDITSQIPFSTGTDYRVFDSVSPGWDSCYIGQVEADNNGNPHICFGLGDASMTNRCMHAVWNGSSWDLNVVDEDNEIFYPTALYSGLPFDGSIRVLDEDRIAIATVKDISTKTEIIEYTTVDGGSSWAEEQITSNGDNNGLVIYPKNLNTESARLLWHSGSDMFYNTGHVFNGVYGEVFIETILAINPISQEQVLDNLDLVQQNILAINGMDQIQNLDILDLIQQSTISIQKSNQSQSLENTDLIQQNILVINAVDQNQTLDNLDLIQQSIISIQEIAQSQNLDPLNLIQQNILVISGMDQSQIIDNITLNVGALLQVAAITQAQSIESVDLIQANVLVINGIDQSQSSGNLDLVQQNILSINKSNQPQVLENLDLQAGIVLQIGGNSQAQAIDNIDIIQQNILAINGMDQPQSIGNVDLTQQSSISINGIDQAQNVSNITLNVDALLQIAAIVQAQNIESINLIQQNTLNINEVDQTQSLGSVNIIQESVLDVDGIDQSQTLEQITLDTGILLQIADIIQNQSLENINLTQDNILEINTLLQSQTMDNVSFSLFEGKLRVIFSLKKPTATFEIE